MKSGSNFIQINWNNEIVGNITKIVEKTDQNTKKLLNFGERPWKKIKNWLIFIKILVNMRHKLFETQQKNLK